MVRLLRLRPIINSKPLKRTGSKCAGAVQVQQLPNKRKHGVSTTSMMIWDDETRVQQCEFSMIKSSLTDIVQSQLTVVDESLNTFYDA